MPLRADDRDGAYHAALRTELAGIGAPPVGVPEASRLIEKGAIVLDTRTKEEFSVSHLPGARRVQFGAWQLIAPLLQSGANPNAVDPWNPGHTALYLAARSGELAPVDALLAAGAKADLRTMNERGQETMALSGALRADSAAVVARLLQAGATVKSTDTNGCTPLHIAAYEGAAQSLPLLIKAGADVDERTPAYRQQTPLMTALQYADLSTTQALINAGANLKAMDNQNKNPCEWAQFFKRDASIVKAVCGENISFRAPIK